MTVKNKKSRFLNMLLKKHGYLFVYRPILGTFDFERLQAFQFKTIKGELFALVNIPPFYIHESNSIQWIETAFCRISDN
jgi:hypothetical protein